MTDAIKVASKIRSDLFDQHGIVASRLWAKSGVIEDMNRMVSEAIDEAVRAERDIIEAILHRSKYTEDQGMDQEMVCYNDGLDEAIKAIRNRKQEG